MTKVSGATPGAPAADGRPVTGLAWADWARVLAIPTVVSLHVLSPVAFAYDRISAPAWWAVNLIDAASRWGVPLFFAVSGALLVTPRTDGVASFYRRRFGRIGPAIVAWTMVFWAFAVHVRGQDIGVADFLGSVARGYPYYHLYFLYAMAGLYLVTPAFRAVYEVGGRKWLGVLALAALAWAAADRVFLALGWASSSNALELWLHFAGFYLAGAWLRGWQPGRTMLGACAVAVPVGILAIAVGTWLLIETTGARYQTVLYSYLSVPTVIVTLAIFVLLVRGATWRPRWLPTIAGLTFGIYLLHPLTLPWLAGNIPLVHGPTSMAVAYLIQMTVALTVSAIATYAMKMVPGLRRLV